MTHSPLCEPRGFCGPFVDADRFASCPGWEGLANCVHCGSTVLVERHLRPRQRSRGLLLVSGVALA